MRILQNLGRCKFLLTGDGTGYVPATRAMVLGLEGRLAQITQNGKALLRYFFV